MRIHRFDTAGTGVWRKWPALVAASVAVTFAAPAIAQAPAAAGGAAPALSATYLEQLVGPIALYPDDLIAIVLPGATNPVQLVLAERFLEKRKADPKLPVDEKWDDAIKSLLNYPDIVKMMSNDLDWTTSLGEAVVEDQGAVLDAIQSFRRRTQSAGNLKTDDKQVIVVEKEVIKIVPSDPQVIYVPQYNPTTVVVYSTVPVYAYYPTPYPVYYYPYPPGAAFATGVIWGAAIGAAWHGNYYGTSWGGSNNSVTINRNTYVNTGNVNVNRGQGSTLPANSTAWKSNKQPGQVSGTAARSASSTRVGYPSAGQGGGMGSAGGAAPSAKTMPATAGGVANSAAARNPTGTASGSPRTPSGGTGASQNAMAGGVANSAATRNPAGTGSASPRTSSGGAGASQNAAAGGSAFGGYGSGRQTQMDSSRGSASLGSMSGSGARSRPSGGGGRR